MTEPMMVIMIVAGVGLISTATCTAFAYNAGHKDGFEEGYTKAQQNPVNPVNLV